MDLWPYISSVIVWSIIMPLVKGKITCDCTTLDCQAERRRTCDADYFCYVENHNNILTRGCINDKTPLLCENRRPEKLSSGEFGPWPLLFCCKDEDRCNRDIIPIKPTEKGKITCDCTTLDCQAERRRICDADYFCYVENHNNILTRGCINDKTPLLCENRRHKKLSSGEFGPWPLLLCCKDEDRCNRDNILIKPTEKVSEPEEYKPIDDANNPYVRHEFAPEPDPCPNTNDSSKLYPIYIAVPVAGVCVLLALIIFAMYLLRRRNDFYANYEAYQYHEQLARLANKQNETQAATQCCDSNINRCTDSERSSHGSETKLILNNV